jgi:hypothetical protein
LAVTGWKGQVRYSVVFRGSLGKITKKMRWGEFEGRSLRIEGAALFDAEHGGLLPEVACGFG